MLCPVAIRNSIVFVRQSFHRKTFQRTVRIVGLWSNLFWIGTQKGLEDNGRAPV